MEPVEVRMPRLSGCVADLRLELKPAKRQAVDPIRSWKK
jgi:hypothetical protein